MSAEARDNPGVIAPPPLIALAALLLGLAFDWLFPAGIIAGVSALARYAIAAILFACGGAMLAAALVAFRRVGTNAPPWEPTTALSLEGIYRYTRNPMYLAFALIVIALAFVFASDWTFPALILYALAIHFGVVLREERYLLGKFGEPYAAYVTRVPRYFGPL